MIEASQRARLPPVHQPARHARAHELLQDRICPRGPGLSRCCCRARARAPSCCDASATLGNAVLVGSQSFWEGVDVRGEALSLVIIDKLPFAPPDDPVLAARIERCNKQGRNALHGVPAAAQPIITLKQGAGRLIRDETDRGVLMICDPRLISKPYGRRIWQSLPPIKRTRVEAEAVAFFAAPRDENTSTK